MSISSSSGGVALETFSLKSRSLLLHTVRRFGFGFHLRKPHREIVPFTLHISLHLLISSFPVGFLSELYRRFLTGPGSSSRPFTYKLESSGDRKMGL